ncbi:High-affinity gluconate transporter GntT [Salmonella enterica subsp. salamae]|uniref:High-affinity gluconate transporter GntT n=1 Tax=Salmonella enterica subsp. salamae TaxID=59202 RepID=A0A6D2G5G5_SALER|nr:High-affinity gluconate transporter GntT [Salmonella enterica subsp. salamae]
MPDRFTPVFLKGIDKPIPEGLYSAKTFTEEEMPGFGVSVWTSLVPVILMAMRAIAEMILPKGHAFLPVAEFLGDPVMATLIAVLIADVHLWPEPRAFNGSD